MADAPLSTAQTVADTSDWNRLVSESAREAFEMMIGASLENSDAEPDKVPAEITAVIGLAGPIHGVFAIRCSNAMANAMAVGMIGKEAMDDPNQPWDALGEVCNIVAGSFKHYTGAVGQNSVLSVPTVIYGCDYHIRPLAQGTVLECVMQAEAGLLHLRLDYKLT